MGWLQQVCLLEAMECHSSPPPPPPPHQDSRQWLQTSQESMVWEHGGQGPSFEQWGLRTRGHCVPGAALGPLCPQSPLPLPQPVRVSSAPSAFRTNRFGISLCKEIQFPCTRARKSLSCPDDQNPIPPPLPWSWLEFGLRGPGSPTQEGWEVKEAGRACTQLRPPPSCTGRPRGVHLDFF